MAWCPFSDDFSVANQPVRDEMLMVYGRDTERDHWVVTLYGEAAASEPK